jgi:hypothetical protein
LWELFWAEAGVHGCTALFPAGAQQAIADKWRAYFAVLDAPFSLLDIATGRGAVLDHAAAAHGSATLQLVGADLAGAPPPAAFPMAYRGGVDAACLPFGDQSFEQVTSQFGVEYAGFEPAVAEAARVCAGGLKMLIHAAEGVVVRQNALQGEQADWILGELRLPDQLHDLFASPSPDKALTIDRMLSAIRTRGEDDENVSLLESVYSAALETQQLWRTIGAGAAQRAVAALSEQLALHRDRMRLLGGVGIDRSRVGAAACAIRASSFEVAIEEERFGADDHLVGYWLEARRVAK